MAVRIRLRRIGKNPKKRVHFRITVADGRRGRDSRIIEEIGFINPVSKEYRLDRERYDYWVSKGAQPSETVAALAKRLAKAPKVETAPAAVKTA
ncbi:MAG: 30S ribosomal protein S16 [Candidatus Omnitrophota bacterium]|jgi:small subunit ribosomal protein S16